MEEGAFVNVHYEQVIHALEWPLYEYQLHCSSWRGNEGSFSTEIRSEPVAILGYLNVIESGQVRATYAQASAFM